MKPYYKKNGFFERLERFSNWIDRKIMAQKYNYLAYGAMFFVPGFNRLTILKNLIADAEYDMRMSERWLKKLRDDYNSKKYFWMAKK